MQDGWRSDGRQQMVDCAQVNHLLMSNLQDELLPPSHLQVECWREPFIWPSLERPCGVEVLKENCVLHLSGRGQPIDQIASSGDSRLRHDEPSVATTRHLCSTPIEGNRVSPA